MNEKLSKGFDDEFRSFFALYVLNLVFGALSMAVGMMLVIWQLVPTSAVFPVTAIPFPVLIVLGCAAFVLGLAWITMTARLVKGMRVVRKAYRQKKRDGMSPEDLTGVMIHMMTQYREQKRIIRVMVVVCLIGGCCYIALGAFDILSAFILIASRHPIPPDLFSIPGAIATAVNLVIGGACILVATCFRRYAKVWDARLDALARSEGELDRMLGA